MFLAGAVHNKFGFLWAIFGRPIFRCIAQFAAFTTEILERYFAGGWWWFCKKTCHKREWIPPEKNIRLRRFHYLNPLPRRSSSFVFALVFLDCLPCCWLVVKLLNQKKPPNSVIFVKVQKNNNWLPKHDWIHHHHCQQQLEQQQVVETLSGSLQNRNWNVHQISPGTPGDDRWRVAFSDSHGLSMSISKRRLIFGSWTEAKIWSETPPTNLWKKF